MNTNRFEALNPRAKPRRSRLGTGFICFTAVATFGILTAIA